MNYDVDKLHAKIDEIRITPAVKDLFKRYLEINPFSLSEYDKFISLIPVKRIGYLFGRCIRQYKKRNIFHPQLKKYFKYQRKVKTSPTNAAIEELLVQLNKESETFSITDNQKKIFNALDAKSQIVYNRAILESISEILMEHMCNSIYKLPDKTEFINKMVLNNKFTQEQAEQIYKELQQTT